MEGCHRVGGTNRSRVTFLPPFWVDVVYTDRFSLDRDLQRDGRLSFATISYNVGNYYRSPDPQVRVYYNEFAKSGKNAIATQFRTALWNDEALVCLPRPS